MKSCFARLRKGGFNFIWGYAEDFIRMEWGFHHRRWFHSCSTFVEDAPPTKTSSEQGEVFVYPSRRLGISSDFSLYIISPMASISSRFSVYLLRLDDIQTCGLMIYSLFARYPRKKRMISTALPWFRAKNQTFFGKAKSLVFLLLTGSITGRLDQDKHTL